MNIKQKLLNIENQNFTNLNTDKINYSIDLYSSLYQDSNNKKYLDLFYNNYLLLNNILRNKQLKTNLSYDLQNLKNGYETILFKKEKPIIKIIDTNQYTYINKQQNFKDISIFNVLKILQKQHKLSFAKYKESINRLKNNKKLQYNVISLISAYYNTIKSKSNKSNLSAINRLYNQKEFLYIQNYKVNLKKNYIYDLLKNYKNYNLITEKVNKEFTQKLKLNNTYL